MATDVSGFVKRLHEDKNFLKRFASEPAAVLSEAGIDATALALPKSIDAEALAKRIDQLFSGNNTTQPAPTGKLAPQELWDRYGAIAWKSDQSSEPPPTVQSVAVAVVIYGASVVTSTIMATTSAVVVGNSPAVMSVDQIATLRNLARQPLSGLSFSISGPDGVKVDGVSAAALEAFLKRAR